MSEADPPFKQVPQDPDAVLATFMAATEARGLSLYPAQEEAVLAMMEGRSVILETPTGSGKSWVASFAHLLARSDGRRSYYTCPIKALVSEKFFQLAGEFGAEAVGMVTGEAQVNPDAPIVVCTQEILAHMGLGGEARHQIGLVVMDEFHFYADPGRGTAWQLPLLCLEKTQFLLMSATLGDVAPVVRSLEAHGRPVAHVRSALRPVPLTYIYKEVPLHETLQELVASGRAPVYVVHFSQRACLEGAQAATSLNLASREEKKAVAQAHTGFRFDSPFGRDMRRLLGHGIGVHHAGLLPKYRRLVERLAQEGRLKLIMGTDTLGVGINVPIRTVLFTQLCKYDGQGTAILTVRDFRQIAGRAGRRGFDTEGFVVAQAPEHVIENRRAEGKVAAGKARGAKVKKPVKKKPPERNYVGWDETTFRRLSEAPVAPLTSHFAVGYPMLLAVLQGDHADANPYRRLVDVVHRCHDSPARQHRHLRHSATCLHALRQAQVVALRPRPARPRLALDTQLQAHFSLDQAQGLWLLDTLPQLDTEAETYPLDLLSLVESVVDSPEVILMRQVDRLRDARMAQLKAEGKDYEERMAELATIVHPKPLADLIYTSFNLFAGVRPWLRGETVRPKSIARDLIEQHSSFHQYVRDLRLERSEGVLLRYLSQVYKTLIKSVPKALRTTACLEVEDFLYTAIAHVDGSLISEWEALVDGSGAPAEQIRATDLARPHHRLDPVTQPQAFMRMLRLHLHRVVAALARRDWEEAASWLVDPEFDASDTAVDETGQTPPSQAIPLADQLGRGMALYFAAHPQLCFDPSTRAPQHTMAAAMGDGRWRVIQVLCDPDGDNDWVLEGMVWRRDAQEERLPCIAFARIGV